MLAEFLEAYWLSNGVLNPRIEQEVVTVVVDWPDPQSVHKRAAVFAVIQDIDREPCLRPEGLSDGFDGMFVSFRPLEKPAVVTNRFLRGVASLSFELVTYINHRVVRRMRVGEDYALASFARFEERG